MNRMVVARALRALLIACGVAAVMVVLVNGLGLVFGPGPADLLLPFGALALCAAGLGFGLPWIDRLVERVTGHRRVTPYSSLAAASRIRAGSLEEALPGLAQVLADGTGAHRAVVWLAVGERLVSAAQYPLADPEPEAENLAMLLARPSTDHLVPVLDGTALRAALVITKPGLPITPRDQELIRDVANGATMLLRGVSLNAELAERVRRADELAQQLHGSRQRLSRAREAERRRLVLELGNATGERLAALRADLRDAQEQLREDSSSATDALAAARVRLDELLDRFRLIARGVYPAVLRDQGPIAALDEAATDLARPVRLVGDLGGRLDWEIESAVYYVVAAAMNALAGRAGDGEVVVELARADGTVTVGVEDAAPGLSPAELRAAVADDAERLTALGGAIELVPAESPGAARLSVRVPDRLVPLVEGSVGAELRSP